MNKPFWHRLLFAFMAIVLIFLYVQFGFLNFNIGTSSGSSHGSSGSPSIEVLSYKANYVVHEDRKVTVEESIRVKFLKSGLTMFYRALPKEKARYTDITATCADNAEFSYYVADNPDRGDFLDINCVGGAERGKEWTYQLSYTMEHGGEMIKNGMIIDVVGFGWPVALNDVDVEMYFPSNSTLNYKLYTGDYSSKANAAGVQVTASSNTSLKLHVDRLNVVYQSEYEEYMAQGVTVEFTLGEGVLQSYVSTRIFSDDLWIVLIVALAGVGAVFVLAMLLPKKQELVTTVNISAPDEMDPMHMGKRLDGYVDDEDITSMIYYFAHKGYLRIDFGIEDNPTLTQNVSVLPDGEAVHARTLFDGLFASAAKTAEGLASVRISQLENAFYLIADRAKRQVAQDKTYDRKSVFGYILGGLFGTLFAALIPLIISRISIGGGYASFIGGVFALPIIVVLVMGSVIDSYRYKWKKGKIKSMRVGQIFVAIISIVLFTAFFATHILTETERIITGLCAFACTFITQNMLVRTQECREKLGHILGFKDFIVYTEEDKIKYMLEENPELFYKILPYAQVLGVTDEWEEKFKNILIEPPQWSDASRLTTFDYLVLNRSLSRAMTRAMTRPQPNGGRVGRGGGGGRFGGFGGGGFGGGGGGAR